MNQYSVQKILYIGMLWGTAMDHLSQSQNYNFSPMCSLNKVLFKTIFAPIFNQGTIDCRF